MKPNVSFMNADSLTKNTPQNSLRDRVHWEFWIDVGGTFTDCLGKAPDGSLHHCKVLSSGLVRGELNKRIAPDQLMDSSLSGEFCNDFFLGYHLTVLSERGDELESARITCFDQGTGTLTLNQPLRFIDLDDSPLQYHLNCDEGAPLIGIRKLMGLRLMDPINDVRILLGTTVGTNALLERNGAKVGLVITKGFADLLDIGTQARSELFSFNAKKPEKIYTDVCEIDERITTEGLVLRGLDCFEVSQALNQLKENGICSIAICLLNACKNPMHEVQIARLAKKAEFENVSVSTRISNTIKFLDRGDTSVVDAYLTPVIAKSLRRFKEKLKTSEVKVMASSGGLIAAEQFSGKDSIFSGPAGGVLGFSNVASQAGFQRSIGFDMGGTSTDVSRFDGEYPYKFDSEIGGFRIVAPMLEIETVAAGGGSICHFDGQRLLVGPQSAGADPGPACYGKGGPLTITDVNLFTGKIDGERFPFPLRISCVKQRIEEIAEAIVETGLPRMSFMEIANGFTEIANAKMALAIKKISLSQGVNPEDYTLVPFGGAGGQHACEIAEILGIRTILCPALGGILSAIGIGMADFRRFAEQTAMIPFSEENLIQLEENFRVLENNLFQELLEEGIPEHRINPAIRILDLRFAGEDSVISVSNAKNQNYLEEFTRKHQQLYGYVHDNQSVEIVTIRVERIGVRPRSKQPEQQCSFGVPKPSRFQRSSFNESSYNLGIFRMESLHSGDVISGPAIVSETYSSLVIAPHWEAEVNEQCALVLKRKFPYTAQTSFRTTERNPVCLELFNNQLMHIAWQMGCILQKTSLSVNVKERLDFSCAILDAKGNLIVNAPHIPVHLGAMSETVKGLLRKEKKVKPGDVFLTNAPDLGGSHLPDLTVMTPVFDSAGKTLLFFTASRAHHTEIGGKMPGSTYPFAKNLAEEGIVFKNVKIVEKGRFLETDLTRVLTQGRYPSRNPQENIADIRAAIAANYKGQVELGLLINALSWDVVKAYMVHIRASAEQKIRKVLSALGNQTYAFEDCLDDGSPIKVKVSVNNEFMTVDFTGSGPVNSNCLNANRAIVQSAILYCLRCLLDEDVPLNSGLMAPVKLILPEGFLNPPAENDPTKHPAVVGGNVEISQRIVDCFLGALGVMAASQGTMNNVVFGNGQCGYYETICGGTGAGPDGNGIDAIHSHMTNTRITDVEILELNYPLRVRRFQIRSGSGGKGKNCGGSGVIREFEFLSRFDVSLLTQRRLKAPFGLKGGGNGKRGRNLLFRKKKRIPEVLPPLVQFKVASGDILRIETPGGGGFGKI